MSVTYKNPKALVTVTVRDTSYTYGVFRKKKGGTGSLRYQVVGTYSDGSARNWGCFPSLPEAESRAAATAEAHGLLAEGGTP